MILVIMIISLNSEILSKRYKYIIKLLHDFKQRFYHEYLTSLRERSVKQRNKGIAPKEGDVVLVHEDTPRIKWKMGRIMNLLPGTDGIVRTVKLKIGRNISVRPVARLYPIETNNSSPFIHKTEGGETCRKPRPTGDGENLRCPNDEPVLLHAPGQQTMADSLDNQRDGPLPPSHHADPQLQTRAGGTIPQRRAALEARQRWQTNISLITNG